MTDHALRESLGPQSPICVFAPSLYLTVTIEERDGSHEAGEVHLHPGGQGFWIARMLAELGGNPVLCGPVGGEAGAVLAAIVPTWGVEFEPVWTKRASPCRVTDRRGGDRVIVADDRRTELHRHDADDLYDKILELSLRYRCCVITGTDPHHTLPLPFFEHLGSDLKELDARVLADIHGDQLGALLTHGALSMLKVSDQDLIADGIILDRSEASALKAIEHFSEEEIDWLVVSRADEGALMSTHKSTFRSRPLRLQAVDDIGAGDSMTAALVMARLRGLSPQQALQLACAAGIANITRHGLASAPAGLIEQIASEIEIEPVRST
ncbi:MAG: PfkB family carbohydrate kinase [Actinomycetota bacterium]